MNSALAELLHLLTSAALQPSIHPLSIAGTACGHKSCRDVLRWSGRVLSSRNLRRSHVAVFVFKQKTARPESDQARRLNKNDDVVLCIWCESISRVRSSLLGLHYVVRTSQISTHFKTRIFNFVKYTKTSSLRNRHVRYSRAFYRLALAISHSHAASTYSFASPRTLHARSIGFGKCCAHRAGKIALQSKPYATWVCSTPPFLTGQSPHPLPNPRALAHRVRAATTRCF